MGAGATLKLAFVLSATDKMSRIVDEAVKKSTDKLSAFERTTGKAARSMLKAGAVMVGAGAAIGGAVFGMAKSTADYAGSVNDMSEATGVGIEAWQKMTYAAKMSGIEQEKLATSLVKFDKTIADAASGSKTAAQTFKDLGIKIKDASGKMRAPDEILTDVAEVFSKVEGGAAKTALACELFGKSGAELMPMLNEGKTGLTGLYKAAQRTGNVLSAEAITASDEFGKKMDAVGLQVKGLGLQLGASLAPAVHKLVNRVSGIIQKVTDWMQQNPQLAETISKVGMVLVGLLVTVGVGSVALGGLTFVVGQFGKAFRLMAGIVKTGQAIFAGFRTVVGFVQVAIAGMRRTTVAANTATRSYMLTQNVATKSTKAYAIGLKLATAGTWLFNKALYGCPIVWIIAGIMAVIAAVVLMVKYWNNIAVFFKKIWAAIVGVFKKAWDGVKKVWGAVTGWFSNLWGGIKNRASKAWTGIKNTISKSREGVKKAWGTIKGWFSNLWDGVKNVTSKAWNGIKTVFLNYTPQGLIIKHWDKIYRWFSNLWGNIKTNIASAWDGIKGWFSNLNPVEWISGAWDRVGGFFGNLGTRFYEWGKNILQGLWNGITSMVNKVVEGVKNIGHKIAKGFKAIFGINSPSKLFAEYGLNITQGLVVGIDHGGGAVESATEGLAANATNGISQSLQTSSVDTSNTFNAGNTGTTLNYSPNITITGGATPEVRDEFSKMLRQHANEIVSIIRRDAENTARLSFN